MERRRTEREQQKQQGKDADKQPAAKEPEGKDRSHKKPGQQKDQRPQRPDKNQKQQGQQQGQGKAAGGVQPGTKQREEVAAQQRKRQADDELDRIANEGLAGAGRGPKKQKNDGERKDKLDKMVEQYMASAFGLKKGAEQAAAAKQTPGKGKGPKGGKAKETETAPVQAVRAIDKRWFD